VLHNREARSSLSLGLAEKVTEREQCNIPVSIGIRSHDGVNPRREPPRPPEMGAEVVEPARTRAVCLRAGGRKILTVPSSRGQGKAKNVKKERRMEELGVWFWGGGGWGRVECQG